MNNEINNFKVNVYGDTFLRRLRPELERLLKIDVEHEMTLNGGTVRKLIHKLVPSYRRKNRRRRSKECTALIMVGIYDIMKFKRNRDDVAKFSRKLKKDLTVLISLLGRYHRNVILLTVIPVLKMQNKHHHWRVLRHYNKHVRSFSQNPNIKVVDLYPLYLKKRNTCNSDLYEINKSSDCRKKDVNVLWNNTGIMVAVRNIIDSVVNVQKLESSNAETMLYGKRDETCNGRLLDEEDARLEAKGYHCSAGSHFVGNRMLVGDACVCLPFDQEPHSLSSSMGRYVESIYGSNTLHIANDVRQKLESIRPREYSYYGEQLLKAGKMKSIENELLTVATYNVLSQELLEKHSYLYESHDHECLNWKTRSKILLEELSLLDADVFCLQEVDSRLVDSFYNNYLNGKGYEGVFKRRTHDKTDGCAIYFKSDRFNLVESSTVEFYKECVRLLNRDNIGIILKLSMKDRPELGFVVATTHLLYNPKRADIRLVQTQVMLAEIERLAYKRSNPVTGQPEYVPIIFTGDMNYSPDSAVYQLVTKSYLVYEGMSNKNLSPVKDGYILNKTLLPAAVGITDSCQYASTLSNRKGEGPIYFESGTLDHHLNLASVYSHMKEDFPEATTNQDGWVTVDYIFYSRPRDDKDGSSRDGRLKLISKLTLPNSKEAETELGNIPNTGCGSDHLPLLATFHVTGP